MTFLVERLSELRKHLDHLEELRPRISATAMRRDLSLHNDVLFSLLTVCQLVIDIASELSARQGLAFDDYTQAVRNLGRLDLVDDATLVELDAAVRVAGAPYLGGRRRHGGGPGAADAEGESRGAAGTGGGPRRRNAARRRDRRLAATGSRGRIAHDGSSHGAVERDRHRRAAVCIACGKRAQCPPGNSARPGIRLRYAGNVGPGRRSARAKYRAMAAYSRSAPSIA